MAKNTAATTEVASEPVQADAGGAGPQDIFTGTTTTRPEVTVDQLASQEPAVSGETQAQGTQQATEAAPQKPSEGWKFKGRTWTDDELLQRYGSNAESIKDMLTTVEQFKTIQQKYVERLEEDRQRQAAEYVAQQQRAQQVQAQQSQRRGPQTMEEFQNSLKPRIQLLKQNGFIDDDDIELSPKLVTLMAHLVEENIQRKEFENEALKIYTGQFQPILQQTQTAQQEYERQSWLSYIHDHLGTLPQKFGDHFNQLTDGTKRAEFISFLTENVNPPLEVLRSEGVDDWLAGQYMAWQRNPILQALSTQNQQRTSAAQVARQMAKGEATGTRGQTDSGKLSDIRALFAKG